MLPVCTPGTRLDGVGGTAGECCRCAHLAHGWTVLEAPRVSAAGVPYLKEMYVDASRQLVNCTFYGYSNGDILYTRDLLGTLHAVAQV